MRVASAARAEDVTIVATTATEAAASETCTCEEEVVQEKCEDEGVKMRV
jgi:hypothetical protein